MKHFEKKRRKHKKHIYTAQHDDKNISDPDLKSEIF